MLKQKVFEEIKKRLKTDKFTLLTPKNPDHGDFAIYFPTPGVEERSGKTPGVNLGKLKDVDLFEKIEQKGNFINFFVSKKALTEEMQLILDKKNNYGKSDLLKNKKIIVEFAHPNTHKLFHIGHLRNIALGESLSRLLASQSTDVVRANYQGDVGLHIAKCIYILMRKQDKMHKLKSLDDKIAFLGQSYTEGNNAYETDEKAKQEINKINQQIFSGDTKVKPLWEETRAWSLEYFDRIYKRLDTKFDRLFFESEVADKGLATAKKALQKGVLSENDGAVILDGEKYGVDTRVFINSLGLPTYEAKELGLAELEFTEFGEIDKCIHVVGPEQASFFKTTIKVEELIDETKYKNKQFHFIYGFVDLKEGKMSSRKGTVLSGEWLLDEVKNNVIATFATAKDKADTIATGATKYAFLKVDAKKKILFDIKESISINGNSGPYLLYTYARCQSVLSKSKQLVSTSFNPDLIGVNQFQLISTEEASLLRTFFRFPEVVADAAKSYSPHLVATYLYDLAQKFNLFYEKCPILKADEEIRNFRLQLTATTAQVLKNGLYLLGIETLSRI